MIHPLPVTIRVPAVEVVDVLIVQEHEKKRHGSKLNTKSISWWDDTKSVNKNLPTHPPPLVDPAPGPVDKFNSRIRGVPNDIESELNQLLSEPSDLVQDTENFITKTINNDFRYPIDLASGATGTLIKEEGILYV